MKIILNYLKRKIMMVNILIKESVSTIRFASADRTFTEILLLSHSLEKGMGMEKPEIGRGICKAETLVQHLSTLENQDSFEYKWGYSILGEYISFQEKMGNNVDSLKKDFLLLNKNEIELESGIKHVSALELLCGRDVDFKKLVVSRHSVRQFSKEKIIRKEIADVIDLAIKCPSACNRQPWKAYCSLDNEKNKMIGKLVPGNKGFEGDIPYYMVITVDKSFFSWHEPFLWYLNGGIFIAFLILAFHSKGIGTCIFEWPDFYKNEKILREILKLEDSREAVIAIVGYGKYTDSKFLKSPRRSVDEILIEV